MDKNGSDLMVIEQPRLRRIGFMKGMGSIPDDFDTMCAKEIADMFEGLPLNADRAVAEHGGPVRLAK